MQSTLAVISLRRIIQNARLITQRAGTVLYAVVKDDAYGHGAERVSLALEPHVRGFAVATVLEGSALRTAGVSKEILVLTPCLSAEEAIVCLYSRLTPAVSSLSSLHLLERAARETGIPFRAQLALNTGMNRYGFRPNLADRVCRRVKAEGGELTGVFSHFYAPEDGAARKAQTDLFRGAAETVRGYFPNAVRHLSATGGILAGAEPFDAARCGLALYGYLPAGFEGAVPVRPAMKLYAACAQNLTFLGGGLCYGKCEECYRKLSTFRLGYGDGFPQKSRIGNLTKLCMDAFVEEGAFRFGSRKLLVSDFKEFAERHDMIVYEALVRLGAKAEKFYV